MKGEKILWRNLPLVLRLIELGAWRNWVSVTTVDLASRLKIPQQTVSRALKDLDHNGFIERERADGRIMVRITGRCIDVLRPVYEKLLPVFEEFKTLRFSGIVTSGLGDGVHYVKVYMDMFERILGFKPYPGTLNLRIVDREGLKTLSIIRGSSALRVESFTRNGRIYGAVNCYRALIEGDVEGAIVVPERTHYGPDIAELIAPENLRKRFNLKDGDRVSVEVKVDFQC